MSNKCPQPECPQPVSRLRKFQIRFDEGSSGERTIYANGRMQVRVLVTLSGTDSNEAPTWLPASITNTVRLIDYNTGAPLDDTWQVSERPNLFSRVRFNRAAQ